VVVPLALLALGFALPMTTVGLWYWRHGAADDLIYWTVLGNLGYTANPISAREAAGRAASSLLPFAIVTAPLWWGAWRSRDAWDDRHARVIALGALVCTLPAVVLGFRFFPHYFVQFYPPLAIATSPWVLARASSGTRGSRLFFAWTTVMVLGFMASTLVLYLGNRTVYRERARVFAAVGERLRRDPCARGGSLFVWGYAPMFYYFSDLPPASRFAVLASARLTGYVPGNLGRVRRGTATREQGVPAHWDWLMADLRSRRATFIIDTAPAGIFRWDAYPMDAFPRLRAYVRDGFELAGELERVRIYRRAGCAARGAR
jgi:hypothetical protein